MFADVVRNTSITSLPNFPGVLVRCRNVRVNARRFVLSGVGRQRRRRWVYNASHAGRLPRTQFTGPGRTGWAPVAVTEIVPTVGPPGTVSSISDLSTRSLRNTHNRQWALRSKRIRTVVYTCGVVNQNGRTRLTSVNRTTMDRWNGPNLPLLFSSCVWIRGRLR